MTVAIIAAVARDGTIGDRGRLPWHIREDLQRFKRLTLGHTVIMGRKTFDSIGRPLPQRRNIVLTRNPAWQPPAGVEVFASLAAALADCSQRADEAVFVIGGAEVYRQALPVADQLFLTQVHQDATGDTRFPVYDPSDWQETQRTDGPGCTFVDYRRRR